MYNNPVEEGIVFKAEINEKLKQNSTKFNCSIFSE